MAPPRALRITRGIVAAAEAAHAKRVIHRDLKPENIMLVERDDDPDFVKVLDFGLAKVESREVGGPPSQLLTRQGTIMGTPGYMPPEQAVGERVDARADLYSIGIILFEMLAGSRPFNGDPVSVLRQHVMQEAPSLPRGVRDAVGPRVEQLVRRLLAKSPGDRVASAAALGLELHACVDALNGGDGAPKVEAPPLPSAPSSARHAVTVRQPTPVATVREPVPAAAAAALSPVAWLSGLWTRLRGGRPLRRSRVGFAWWTTLVDHVRARRRKRRLRALLAAPAELGGRLRAELARRGLRLTDRQWALVLAITAAVLVLGFLLLLLQ
jgi:serine/threonine-protein kinase